MKPRQQAIGDNQEWLTPPHILEALGPFDLDPCSPVNRPWDTAARHYSILDDGLLLPWDGRIWLNPPYDRRQIGHWLNKMAVNDNGILLMFARTDTAGFHTYVFEAALPSWMFTGIPAQPTARPPRSWRPTGNKTWWRCKKAG